MTTMDEPEWDQETRDLALAHAQVDLCPSCGGPAYLCQDPELQDSWRVPAPTRCHRSTALLQAQLKVTEKTNPQVGALLWSTVLADDAVRRG
ncbi:MAG: hypothetical protein ABIR39_19810 [Nocardioides sp.]|uniref:hypothetical protein n=1 Tax=Nocardioides sp. TaxID=35761 RepID=UPI00326487EB